MLNTFNIGVNKLRVLPQEISNLKELRHFWCFTNELENVPDEMFNLPYLQEVILNNNKFGKRNIEKIKKLSANKVKKLQV